MHHVDRAQTVTGRQHRQDIHGQRPGDAGQAGDRVAGVVRDRREDDLGDLGIGVRREQYLRRPGVERVGLVLGGQAVAKMDDGGEVVTAWPCTLKAGSSIASTAASTTANTLASSRNSA